MTPEPNSIDPGYSRQRTGSPAPEPERLSIAHLLVWTALSAVLLGIDRATQQLPHVGTTLYGQVLAFIYAPLFGASVSALLLAAWRATGNGPRFPAQPGHWLLVIAGVQSLLHLSIGLIQAVAPLGYSWEMFQLSRLVESLAGGTMYVLALRDSRRFWRLAFAVGLVGSAFSLAVTAIMEFWLIAPFLFSLERALSWLTLAICLVAVIDDRLTHTPRDYLHWTGLIVRLLYLSLVTAVPYLLRWLEDRPG